MARKGGWSTPRDWVGFFSTLSLASMNIFPPSPWTRGPSSQVCLALHLFLSSNTPSQAGDCWNIGTITVPLPLSRPLLHELQAVSQWSGRNPGSGRHIPL